MKRQERDANRRRAESNRAARSSAQAGAAEIAGHEANDIGFPVITALKLNRKTGA